MNEKQSFTPDDLIRRMFDLSGRFIPAIRCPFCAIHPEDNWDTNIPHMRRTIFGDIDKHRSGPGLLIEFQCENGHNWQLRFSDQAAEPEQKNTINQYERFTKHAKTYEQKHSRTKNGRGQCASRIKPITAMGVARGCRTFGSRSPLRQNMAMRLRRLPRNPKGNQTPQ